MPYRPPELFDPAIDMVLDCRTDIWSLGCLLFAWWYGYSPFESEFVYQDNVNSNTNNGNNNGSSNSSGMNNVSRELTPISGDNRYNTPTTDSRDHIVRYVETQQSYQMKVVPCSHLRVLSSLPKRHSNPPPLRQVTSSHTTQGLQGGIDPSSNIVDELVHYMVNHTLSERPFIKDIKMEVSKQIQVCNGHTGSGYNV